MTLTTKTIVVLIALAEEHAQFQSVFGVLRDHSTTQHIRLEHHCDKPGFRIISVLAEQMGSQSALFSADSAIQDFAPDLVVVLGIAGGISDDLTVGDVCVSNEVIDVLHNSKVIEVNGKTEITFAPDFYAINAELVSSFTFFKAHPNLLSLLQDWRKIGASADDARLLADAVRADGPELHIGPIACGPVVTSPDFNLKLKALHRKVAAIETESGGVFGRLSRTRIPAVTIRGISDMADGDKAELETRTKGGARRLAMLNATNLLKQQMHNDRFLSAAIRHHDSSVNITDNLFPEYKPFSNIVADLDTEIRAKLAERSVEFRAKPENFYLPIPRARKIGLGDDLIDDELEAPVNIVDCLQADKRVLIRLPRSYPSQALGWSLAHALIRQAIDSRIVLPYVVSGSALNPPSDGFSKLLPKEFLSTADSKEFLRIIIIEEPPFHARNRIKFISSQLDSLDALFLVITKSEDQIASVDDFVRENGFKEYELSPVSFTETAFFLEKAFDMSAREAEAVAIRLDDTFKKFKLDAHPTYFAGLQEETLAALINANKRAELIQLAVDALLTLMVAVDKSKSLCRNSS